MLEVIVRVSVPELLNVLDEDVVEVPLDEEVPLLETDELPVVVLDEVVVLVMRAVDVDVGVCIIDHVSRGDQEDVEELVGVKLFRKERVSLLLLKEE